MPSAVPCYNCSLMKIAVLGLGFMGSTHLKALKNIPDAEITAVASFDEKQLTGDLSSVQGNLGGPGEVYDFSTIGRYTNPEDAIADPNVEAVDICLPTDLHASVTLAALRAGKHVLVEKPMALNGAAADEMVAEAARSGKILMTAQVLRFVPEYLVAARKVRNGDIGPVRSAIFRRRCSAPAWSQWLGDASRSGGGVFDLLIHDVDMVLRMFGQPLAVSASGHEDMSHGIDVILAQFHFNDSKSVIVTGGWHHPKAYPFSMEFTIVGDGATLEYNSAVRPLTQYNAEGQEHVLELPAHDGYQAELEYFVECATQGKQPDLCPPAESSTAVKLAAAMVESRRRNGERIECLL